MALLIEFLIGTIIYAFIGKYVLGLLLVIHPLFAFCNGTVSSRLFLLFHGTDWAFLALASAFSVPFFSVGVLSVVDVTNP